MPVRKATVKAKTSIKKHLPAPVGLKYDDGKAPMALLDNTAMLGTAQVLAFGAKKYTAHNWRNGITYSRLASAAMRHIMAFLDGEDLDPESGLPHVDHAACCLMFLQWMAVHRPDMDDRFKEDA